MSDGYKLNRAPSSCPVCGADGGPLLTLPASPIYQHPVPHDALVEPPYTTDLCWLICNECAHAWQPNFDRSLLERIYKNHYYTPAPSGIGMQFRNEFLLALQKFRIDGEVHTLLEIGASDGDVLAELRTRLKAKNAYAFEPNIENAVIAEARGLDVKRQFFGSKVDNTAMIPADFTYARHVIEHIFDFKDFFTGLNSIATTNAKLVLETPSLDFHVQHSTLDPFHIEHIHVFSLRSLAKLGSLYGWSMNQNITTQDGNLIVSFIRGPGEINPPAPNCDQLQHMVEAECTKWRSIAAQNKLLFWGAGSCGVTLANIIGREPDAWTDGNPAKVGKRIVGHKSRILSPKEAFSVFEAKYSNEPVLLVIASSFIHEILPQIKQYNWNFGIIDSSGNSIA